MPANTGHFRRQTRREGALERRLADVETYKGDSTKKTKLSIAEKEIEALRNNIQMPKRGRSW